VIKRKDLVLASVVLLALSFVAGGLYRTYADIEEGEESGFPFRRFIGGWRMRGRFFNCLEEEQAQELREMVEDMKADDAEPEDIRAAVQEYLEDHGVECDWPELTEEQVQGLEQLRVEIQKLVKQRTSELGIEFPEIGHAFSFRFRGRSRGFPGMRHGFGSGYKGGFRGCMTRGNQEG
jgi:hypothetical protein